MHKALGYGITGLAVDSRGRITDERVNTASILLDWDASEGATVRAFVTATAEPGADVDRILRGWRWEGTNPDSSDPFDAVEDFHETTLTGSLLLRPVGWSTLRRSDDTIDATQELLDHGGAPQDRLEALGGGFYPFGNLYMDALTHERLRWGDVADWVRAKNGWRGMDAESEASDLCALLGWDAMGSTALGERVVPMPPDEVLDLARFGQLFTDPATAYSLRPMLATFWR